MAVRNLPEKEDTFSISAFPILIALSSLRIASVIYGRVSIVANFDKSNSVRGIVLTPKASNSDG